MTSNMCEPMFEIQSQMAACPLIGLTGSAWKYCGIAPDNIFFQKRAPYERDYVCYEDLPLRD